MIFFKKAIFSMNSKIFSHVKQKLFETWHLPRHAAIRDHINENLRIDQLPWTPKRREKFIRDLEVTFGVNISLEGTLTDLVAHIDQQYLAWFFGEVWKPRTDRYHYTGWWICDEINKTDPKRVLDVGCGYNPFKGRIQNLIGIDPYNNCADFMVDILNYDVPDHYDHIIALGSINFNSRDDIEKRFAKCVGLMAPGARLWMRCNPGIAHGAGPWIDIFPWSFRTARELADKHNLCLETMKQDQDRLFFLFSKS